MCKVRADILKAVLSNPRWVVVDFSVVYKADRF